MIKRRNIKKALIKAPVLNVIYSTTPKDQMKFRFKISPGILSFSKTFSKSLSIAVCNVTFLAGPRTLPKGKFTKAHLGGE